MLRLFLRHLIRNEVIRTRTKDTDSIHHWGQFPKLSASGPGTLLADKMADKAERFWNSEHVLKTECG